MIKQTAFSQNNNVRTVVWGLSGAVTLLPFALAFGVNSPLGLTMSLLTAVAAGLLTSFIFQNPLGVSVPTCAVFLLFSAACAQLGVGAALTAALCAGALVFFSSFLKPEKLAPHLPMPLILGFLTGIMIVMGILQVNNYFGIRASGVSAMQMLSSYTHVGFHCNWRTMLYGTIVLVVLITYPRTFKKFSRLVPAPFVGIVAALLLNLWLIPSAETSPITEIGSLSGRLLPEAGMLLDLPSRHQVPLFLLFVTAMAALILGSSLLARQKGADVKQTATDQGLSNIFLACIGGMPVAPARGERKIPKYAGAFQSLFLLAFLLVFGKTLLRLPISTLAVILIVTAFQQVDWAAVKALFLQKSKAPAAAFLVSATLTVLVPLPAAIACIAVSSAGYAAVKVVKEKKSLLPKLEKSDSMETL